MRGGEGRCPEGCAHSGSGGLGRGEDHHPSS